MRRVAAVLAVLAITAPPLPEAAGAPAHLTPAVSPAELERRLGTSSAPRVIDVRSPAEFRVGHVPGAVNIPDTELADSLDVATGADGIVLYCIAGRRTRRAEALLRRLGVAGVSHLEGGLSAWIRGGHPVAKGP